MASQAKRHHIVSRFYLRHFANEDERITTVMLPGDRTFQQSVGDASVQTRFYTALGHDGEPTDAAEAAFGVIEGAAANAWLEVCEGTWPLPNDLREHMAGWIGLQLLRGNSVRTSMSQIGTELLQMEVILGGRRKLRDALRDIGEPHDDETVNREWVALFREPLAIEVTANHHLQYLSTALDRVTESLLNRWWVLTTFERKGLATSDHPVYVLPNPTHVEIGLGTGIENADTIHVPLTRRHSLAMALRSTLPDDLAGIGRDIVTPGVTATALYSNSCTVNSARRMLFHHPDDSPLTGLTLHPPRSREMSSSGDPWRFMSYDDRRVLIEAGVQPPLEEGDAADDEP